VSTKPGQLHNVLWPALAVTTGPQIGVEKDALIVPTEVVQHSQNGLYVFIVDDQNRRTSGKGRASGRDDSRHLEGRSTAW
jgi:multidrug efflux system membrane fusion protein